MFTCSKCFRNTPTLDSQHVSECALLTIIVIGKLLWKGAESTYVPNSSTESSFALHFQNLSDIKIVVNMMNVKWHLFVILFNTNPLASKMHFLCIYQSFELLFLCIFCDSFLLSDLFYLYKFFTHFRSYSFVNYVVNNFYQSV